MSEPTAERETCPDCGCQRLSEAVVGLDRFLCCFADGSDGTELRCARRTIANLRAALAEATKLREAERAVVEAAMAWRANAKPSSKRYDNSWWRLYDAVEALRAEAKNG